MLSVTKVVKFQWSISVMFFTKFFRREGQSSVIYLMVKYIQTKYIIWNSSFFVWNIFKQNIIWNSSFFVSNSKYHILMNIIELQIFFIQIVKTMCTKILAFHQLLSYYPSAKTFFSKWTMFICVAFRCNYKYHWWCFQVTISLIFNIIYSTLQLKTDR